MTTDSRTSAMGMWVGVVGAVLGVAIGGGGVLLAAYFFFSEQSAACTARVAESRANYERSVADVRNESEREKGALKERVDTLEDELREAVHELEVKDAQLAAMEADLRSQLERGLTLAAEAESMRQHLDAVGKERDKLAASRAQANKRLQEARKANEAAANELERVHQQLRDSEATATQLTNMVVESRQQATKNRTDAAHESWIRAVETAINGECKGRDLVRNFDRCEAEVRVSVAGLSAKAISCYMDGYSGPVYLAGAKVPSRDSVALNRGIMMACDRTLRDGAAAVASD